MTVDPGLIFTRVREYKQGDSRQGQRHDCYWIDLGSLLMKVFDRMTSDLH